MTIVRVPSDGVPAVFTVDVPPPAGLSTVGGVRLTGSWSTGSPYSFRPRIQIADRPTYQFEGGYVGTTATWNAILWSPVAAPPCWVTITVDLWMPTPQPGQVLTLTLRSAATEDGQPPLNPEDGGAPYLLSDPVTVGSIEVVSWEEWRGINEGGGS